MKKKLLVLSSVLLLIVLFAFSASALTVPSIEFNSDSTFKPVDYSSHKSVSTVTLYGNADYICMKAFADTNNDRYCLDVYSDSSYKKLLWSYTNTYSRGTSYQNILFDLTGAESRTYYAKAYVQKVSIYGYHKTDDSTVVKFKVVVNKGSSAFKNAKLFMYGYENTYNGPAVYWFSVPGATGYYVYRYNGSEYVKIATVKATSSALSYYVDTANKNVCERKYYKVKAYNSSGTTAFSQNNLLAYVVKAPTIKASVNTSGGIKVTWNDVHSTCDYLLYRRTANSDWKRITDTSSTTYNDKNVKSNEVYYYTVRAYNKNTVSGYHPTGASLRYVDMTQLNSVTAANDGLNVSWKAVSGAERYYLYRRANTTDSWERLVVLTGTSYKDTSVERNRMYYYTVRAEIGSVKGPYNANGVSGALVDAVALNEVTQNEKGETVLSWQGVGGDVTYRVYRKGPDDTSWVRIGSTTKTQYTEQTADLNNGEQYSYTLRAFVGSIGGGYDNIGKTITYYGKIQNFEPYNTVSGVGFKWKAVAGAEGYNIYRKAAEEDYVLLGSTDQTYYEDTTAEIDVDYTYKVAYVLNSAEVSNFAAERTVKIVANNVKLSEQTYAYTYNNLLWTIKLDDYDKDLNCIVYIKNGDTFKEISRRKLYNKELTIHVDADVYGVNEFAFATASDDGSVLSELSAETVKLEKLPCRKPTVTINHAEQKVTVSWDAIEGITACEVYRDNDLLATVTDANEYVDTDAKPGVSYAYYIKMIKGNCSTESSIDRRWIIETPEVKAKVVDYGIQLTWDSCGSRYVIYRKTDANGEWEKLDTYAGEYYVDETAQNGVEYYYTVQAFDSSEGYGAYDEYGVKVNYFKSIRDIRATQSTSKIKLTWDEVPGATGYRVYSYNTSTGKYTKLGTVQKLNGTISGLKAGTTYCYLVRPYKQLSDGTVIWAEYSLSDVYCTATKCVAPTLKATAGTKKFTLTWNKVAGATEYEVWYSTSANGTYKKLTTVTGTSYSKSCTTGKTYYFKVRAMKEAGFSMIKGEASSAKGVKIK